MAKITNLAVLTAVLSVGGQASAEVVWKGDYECGDLTQWSKVQAVADERLEITTEQLAEGSTYALKATVQQGDNPIGASGNRNELAYTSFEPSGTERFYRWQTMFSEDYPSADTWQLFTQWHHVGPNGSPPVQFLVRGEKIILSVDNKRVWDMPLERGRWIDFTFHVLWSSDPSVGFVELFVDGERVLEKTAARTQFPGEVNYLKQGLYRDASVGPTGVVYHDGMTVGTELSDVLPPAPVAAVEPVDSGEEPAVDSAVASAAGSDGSDELMLASGGGGGCSAAPGAATPLMGMGVALFALLRRRRGAKA